MRWIVYYLFPHWKKIFSFIFFQKVKSQLSFHPIFLVVRNIHGKFKKWVISKYYAKCNKITCWKLSACRFCNFAKLMFWSSVRKWYMVQSCQPLLTLSVLKAIFSLTMMLLNIIPRRLSLHLKEYDFINQPFKTRNWEIFFSLLVFLYAKY